MMIRGVLIAVTVFALASAATAEPAKPVKREADRPASHQVVLASADAPRNASALSSDLPAPAKPARVARVTTCRCGNAAAQQDEGER